ncbi:MAG: leader peptide processing enzyme [Spirochaetaceae bacterium]|nr:leader peptide processing enzyme [Spirochaetaceae bacterium]
MNKKVNTLLFVLGATVVNILITILVFILLFVVCVRLLPPDVSTGALPFVFIAALAASFFIYNKLLKIVTKKVDMDKYFDPIFKPRRRK